MSWATALETDGWATLDGRAATEVASVLGHRTSEPMRLEPKDATQARAWSLSGTFGLDAFPWHTDGAISSDPPRWLLLRAVELSDPTRTELLIPPADLLGGLHRTTLRAVDQFGRARYLPAVVPLSDGNFRLRWDPRTCTPRTGLAIEDVEGSAPTVHIEWFAERLLVIDNYKVLHRRPAIHRQTNRLLERTYVWER